MLHRTLLLLALLAAAGCGPAPQSTTTAAREAAAPAAGHTTPTVEAPRSTPARVVTLEVGGMTCASCVARVHQKLAAVPGVHKVDVSLDDQRALVVADASVADTALTAAVRRAGPEFLGLVRR